MGVLKGVLKEEAGRLQQTAKSYQLQIAKLPKGSVQAKKLKGIYYYYLAYRKGGKVIYRYLGRSAGKSLQALKQKIQDRRRYEVELRKTLVNLNRLRKIIYGKRNAI